LVAIDFNHGTTKARRATQNFRTLNDPNDKILSQMREFASKRCS
jgi:hypothetical protein